MNLIRTSQLRFVEKWIPDPGNSMLEKKVRVLQQAFMNADTNKILWQDVPLETEGER